MISTRLNRRRQSLGIRIIELVAPMGYTTHASVSSFERGLIRKPKPRAVKAWAKKMKVSERWVMNELKALWKEADETGSKMLLTRPAA